MGQDPATPSRVTRSQKRGHGTNGESTQESADDTPEILYQKRVKRGFTLDEHLALLSESVDEVATEPFTIIIIQGTPNSGVTLQYTPVGEQPYWLENCENEYVELTNHEHGKEWTVKWNSKAKGDPHRKTKRDGWSAFLKAHKLEAGDVCLFKQVPSRKSHLQFGFDIRRAKPADGTSDDSPSGPGATSTLVPTPACLKLADNPGVERGYKSDGDGGDVGVGRRYCEAHIHVDADEPSLLRLKFHYYSDCSLGLYAAAGANREELRRSAAAGWPRKAYVPTVTTTTLSAEGRSEAGPSKLKSKRRGKPSKKRVSKDQGIVQNASPKRRRPRRSEKRTSSAEDEVQNTSLIAEAPMAEPSIAQPDDVHESGPSLQPSDNIQSAAEADNGVKGLFEMMTLVVTPAVKESERPTLSTIFASCTQDPNQDCQSCELGKLKSWDAVDALKLHNPSVALVMKCCVNELPVFELRSAVTIPFVNVTLPESSMAVTLELANPGSDRAQRRTYEAKWSMSLEKGTRLVLGDGWKSFVIDYNLIGREVCVFHLTDNVAFSTVEVHVLCGDYRTHKWGSKIMAEPVNLQAVKVEPVEPVINLCAQIKVEHV